MRTVTFLLVLLLIGLQGKLWFGASGMPGVWDLKRQINAQKQENAGLKERNQALEAEVEDLKQGVEAVEERARSELGFIKRGEVFFQVVERPAVAPMPEKQP